MLAGVHVLGGNARCNKVEDVAIECASCMVGTGTPAGLQIQFWQLVPSSHDTVVPHDSAMKLTSLRLA